MENENLPESCNLKVADFIPIVGGKNYIRRNGYDSPNQGKIALNTAILLLYNVAVIYGVMSGLEKILN